MENINDLIYAYSLGCLDSDEFQSLNSQLDNSEEEEGKELGEYQNLVSLLPCTLTLENPDPALKDNVAKKLYRLKDEIKAQRQKNKPIVNIPEAKEESEQDKSLKEPEEILPIENNTLTDNLIEEKEVQQFINGPLELPSSNKLSKTIPVIPNKKNNSYTIWGAVLFFILVIGIMIAYMKVSFVTNNLNDEVDKLKKEVGSLNVKLIGNQEIQEMLQSPDVQVINLKGENNNPNSSGKLIIGSDRGTGYIQFYQMPVIPEDKLFQLWVGISGNYIKLKSFHPSDTIGFYSFKILNLPKGDEINFSVTEEPSKNSIAPSNKVFLRGTLVP
jgi:hypothetical protein